MKAFLVAFLVLGSSNAVSQSSTELLQRVADHYQRAMSYEVTGTASALVPGTSWRVTYDFETQAASPTFLPLSVRKPAMRVLSRVHNFKMTRAVEGATDPEPSPGFGMIPFGQYSYVARLLIDAQKIGTETITVQDHTYLCEVIDAIYDFSPKFKPKSMILHRHLSIAPSELLVLRETRTADGLDWTANVKSFSFDRSPSEEMVKSLQSMDAKRDRPEWVGRQAPDFTLPQLSEKPVTLSQLRGKPVLLDFWGSYCSPCRLVTQHAQELASQYESSNLTVLTLTEDTAEDAKLWTDAYNVKLPVLLDKDGAAFKAFGITGVPDAILVGEDGRVIHYWVGLDELSEMDSVLRATLTRH